MSRALSNRLRGAVTHALVRGPGLRQRLRARRWGLDRLNGRDPALELYYEPGDPHSHLCAQLLARLRSRLDIEVHVRVVGPPETALYPEAERQRAFALEDARRIAPAWGLRFATTATRPRAEDCHAAALQLAACDDLDAFIDAEAVLAPALFSGGTIAASSATTGSVRLQENEHRRRWLGHYLPGMWQFDGEWFWGLDRLGHLERRLRARGVLRGDTPLMAFDASRAQLPALDTDDTPLEFFFSFRSPYSYLAAELLRESVRRYRVPVRVRPVLPMVMRGLKVPTDKRLYIVRDVYREAQSLGIAFGRIADPVGEGARRCLQTFPLARDLETQLAFLSSASRACWSEAVDPATDAGLRYACERASLSWAEVAAHLKTQPSLDYAEENRRALFDAGFWGVPTFRLGSFATWGRDRLWMVEEMLRRAGRLGDA